MTRVLLISTGLPTMFAEIVSHSVSGHDDVYLLIEPMSSAGLLDVVRESGADVVVGAESELPCDQVSGLLHERPLVRVFTLTPDARMTWLYELRPERVAIGEVSAERLAEAIRAARPRVPCGPGPRGERVRHG